MIDTIYALASAPGRGGVAVLRVSGPQALLSLQSLCAFDGKVTPRRAYFRAITDNVSRETIDHGVVMYFKAPHSFTGEDVIEYHVHGGKAIIDRMVSALGRFDGHRMAAPGEFTRRGFENGKMDLTQAEAIADLVDAETEMQRVQALAQAGGALSGLYEDWRARLVRVLAYTEAHLDFPDEEDVPVTMSDETRAAITTLADELNTHLNDACRGERLRSGIQVAIIGPPNAGKSSLLNALARREVAIVSDMAGTTRDVLEVGIDLNGYPIVLVDTAGLRPEQLDGSDQSKIEEEGIRRAYQRAKDADFKVLLFDGAQWPNMDKNTTMLADEDSLVVVNKADLISDRRENVSRETLFLSVHTEQGFDDFMLALSQAVEARFAVQSLPSLTRERHREALMTCAEALAASMQDKPLELISEDLRKAAMSLGSITGKIDVEQLLDVIFRDFCIGK